MTRYELSLELAKQGYAIVGWETDDEGFMYPLTEKSYIKSNKYVPPNNNKPTNFLKTRVFPTPTRVWVNAPSIHQPDHRLHGKVGIVWTDNTDQTKIYFPTGLLESQEIKNTSCLETKNSQTDAFKINK